MLVGNNLMAQCPGPSQRQALLNLQRAIEVEGTRAGQIPLTDTCGNQRYSQYTEINPTPIAYTPSSTGNPATNYSEFVTDPAGDIWYIDWQGRGLQLTGGGSTCDVDWLEISDNSCPDAISDSIYKQKYASIGARYVWPGAELLVNDSTASGIVVVQGSRNARLALYDSGAPGTFLMIDHGGTTPVVYMPVAANLVFKTTAGTPQTPVGSQVSHFAINTQDSTIQMFQYPETRNDTETPINFLYTDAVGKIRSKPASSFPLTGLGGIYGGSGDIATGAVARITSADNFTISYNNFAPALYGDDGVGGIALTSKDGTASVDVGNGGILATGNGMNFITPNLALSNGATAAELQFLEPSGGGTSYVGFKAPALAATTQYTLPNSFPPSATGYFLSSDLTGGLSWAAAGGGSGTVTSVGLSLPAIFSVSGSPVTTSGTLTGSLATQTANTIFAGPTSGGAATPTFRALANADLPVGAGGAWIDGGNSFGATGTIGTNDANTLAFETNGTTRATLNTSGVFSVTDESATTNNVVQRLAIGSNSSGTPAAGIGSYMSFLAETSTTPNVEMARISGRCSFITHASYAGSIDFYTASSGSAPMAKVTIDGNGSIGVGTTSPFYRLSNTSGSVTDGAAVTSAGIGWAVSGSSDTYAIGISNTGTGSLRHGAMFESNATDNASRALTVSVGSTPTRVLTVNCDKTVGILDETPEAPLDVTGLAKLNHLSGQNLTPTILVSAAAGTGASAAIVTTQSSDLAIRFSISSGTSASAGLWATITFDDAFVVPPIVVIQAEGTDTGPAIETTWSVTCSTTTAEIYLKTLPVSPDSKTYEYSAIVIGGK